MRKVSKRLSNAIEKAGSILEKEAKRSTETKRDQVVVDAPSLVIIKE